MAATQPERHYVSSDGDGRRIRQSAGLVGETARVDFFLRGGLRVERNRQSAQIDGVSATPRKCGVRAGHAVPATDRLEVLRAGAGPARVVDVALPFVRVHLRTRIPPETSLTFLKCDGFFPPPTSIRPFPEIASDFAAELDRVHPGEPLILVGYSMSGLIALELAHQLGRPDLEVVLVEPPLPGILPTRASRAGPSRPAVRARPGPRRVPPARFDRMFHKFRSRLWNRILYGSLELFLRPYFHARHSRWPFDSQRFQSWWFYLPQIHKQTMAYKAPAYKGRVHLLGRAGWLENYARSWTC